MNFYSYADDAYWRASRMLLRYHRTNELMLVIIVLNLLYKALLFLKEDRWFRVTYTSSNPLKGI